MLGILILSDRGVLIWLMTSGDLQTCIFSFKFTFYFSGLLLITFGELKVKNFEFFVEALGERSGLELSIESKF